MLPGVSVVVVERGVEPFPCDGSGDRLHRAGLAVASIEPPAGTAELARFDDLAVRHLDQRAGGDVQPGFDDTFIPEADADAGFSAQQAALADGHLILSPPGQRAHDRRTTADVAAVADDDTGGDAALDHRAA